MKHIKFIFFDQYLNMDFKLKYLTKCVQNLLMLGQPPQELSESQKMAQFLQDPKVGAIFILFKEGKKLRVMFPSEQFKPNPAILMVTILKMKHQVTMNNLSQAYSISLSNSDAIKNFGNEISQLYLPYAENRNSNIEKILKTMQGFLGDQQLFFDNDESQKTLESLKDQFNFWQRMFDHAMSPDMKKKAEYHIEAYKEIKDSWLSIQQIIKDPKQLKQLIEITFDALSKIWEESAYNYNKGRFAKLLTIFTFTLWKSLSVSISKITPQSKGQLKVVEQNMKLWINTLKEYKDTLWRAKPFEFPIRLNSFEDKLNDVKKVLGQLQEIKIISSKISQEIDLKEISEVFQDTVPLSLHPTLQKNWQKAKKKFQYILQSKIHMIASFFKMQIASVSRAKSKPIKVLQDLHKWNSLLALNQIEKALYEEKEQIFKIIQSYIDNTKHEFQSRTGQSFDPIPGKQSMPKIKNFTPFLCGILWVRQAEDKVRRIQQYCKQIFIRSPQYETFIYESNAFLEECKNYQKDQLQKWIDEVTEATYSDAGLGLNMNSKMMDLDLKRSILTVNYSERLILLIRQVRQVAQLGLKGQIPEQILDVAQSGKKYYKEALSLKKIANFYNNMGDELIDCQRGMLLTQLQNFEDCVNSINSSMTTGKGGSITWDNPEQVHSYIKQLNQATNDLMKQNNRLRKIHDNIMEVIIQLANYNIRKNRNMWLTKLEQIKSYVESACANKEAKYCRKWKIHCDVQLYKVLELQFLLGLEDSESVMPQISVDIIIKNKSLTFKPSVQELKDKYYREINNYLMWPSRSFRGIIGNLDLYQRLGDRNSLAIRTLLTKAQSVFSILSTHMRSLDQWNNIPYLNIKSLEISSMDDWQFNIRVIRMKRKQLEKVTDYQKIESFNINHTKFKNLADQYLVDFLETMMNALKESVINDTNQIQKFLGESLAKLSKKPQTLEQMQIMKNTYLDIKGKQKQTKRKIEQILIKKKWIIQATGYQHPTQQVQASWEQFSIKLQDYDQLLAQQIQHLKGKIQGRINDINHMVSKYQSQTLSIIMPTNRQEINQLILVTLPEYRQQEQKIGQLIQNLKKDCEQFELPVPMDLNIKKVDWQAWDLLIQYTNSMKLYELELFEKIKVEKLYAFQDKCLQWHEKVKHLEKNRQVIHIIKQVDLFKSLFTLLRSLSSGILKSDHWRSYYGIIKVSNHIPSQLIKLGDMLNNAKFLVEKMQALQELVARAQGEATLAEALDELAIWWQTTQFQLFLYEGKRNKCSIIKEWKEIINQVSDNMSLVSSLKQNRFAGKFLQQIELYQKKIGQVQRALYSLKNIQRRYVYLEPILVGGALPEQLERFNKIDNTYRNLMARLAEKPKMDTLASEQGLDSTLDTIQQEQQRCLKALNDYLQVKRSKFPRFYFLGDEDLLQILAQTQNPSIIQLHMKKLFAAINTVGFTIDNKFITEIHSIQKEKVILKDKVQLSEKVQDWLIVLQKSMFATLEHNLREYIKEGGQGKQIKLTEYPSQILCLMEQIRFSDQLQAAIKGKNIKALDVQLRQNLQNLTKILPTVGKLEALKLKAIILDLIHHLNVVSLLAKDEKPITLNSYNYKKNFKFTTAPQMHMLGYKYKYTFQYQGNLPKLVHTPLTDKCYITLGLALSLGLGGNPYGPAGTGKTETVKAMAMLFGRMCLVFNCDQGLDYKSMGRIFLGLIRCGAWGCFDQFNRLLQQQLSAISQQIQIIQFAIKANQPELELLGKKVNVNPNSGIFVTLNPAGKGYGGRSRLPDNLKQLFRPVAMSVPDNELIAQVLLYSQGFKEAKQLASKVITLFTLSRQLLSQQQHYDWGLRALKTILSVAGRLIFQQRSKNKDKQLSFETQSELLIKAIRVNTLSKLTFNDMRKFKFLLTDIFPGVQSKDIHYEDIEKVIQSVLEEMKLASNEAQISKVLQFYEATKQRMGVVLVGPSGCGKTTIWKVLKRCYEKLSIPLKTYLMNPKSMPRQQLLGHMNNDTRQFNEGVLTVSARQVVKNPGNNWIILDGDIDPEWIESLNSVLDDNHLLTLPTGQRINFPNGTCFIFETDSLLYASPATVSRMGMIYLNNQDINIEGVLEKWVQNQPHLKNMLAKFNIPLQTSSGSGFLLGYDEVVQSTLIGQLNQILSQMRDIQSQEQFIAAMMRGVTANYLNHQEKNNVINKIFEKMNQRNPFPNLKQSLALYAEGKSFRTFSNLPQQFSLQQIATSKNGAMYQTVSTQSYLAVLKPWVQSNQHFMVVGPEGCGKGLLIRQAFSDIKKLMKINFSVVFCNSQTNANHIIQKLYQICLRANSGNGKILRPKDCSRLVLYLKDVNLPKPDKYQTIQLASFLQQVISHKGFYDPTTLQFVQLDQKIQIVISMLPPSSIGRNQLTQRLTAIMRISTVDYPSNQDLGLIYNEYFKSLLRQRKISESHAKSLTNFFIDIYIQLKNNFSVDQHRHYSLTPKNLLQIFKNLTKYEITQQEAIVDAINNQFSKNYRNKVVSIEKKNKYDQIISGLAKQHFRSTGSAKSISQNLFTSVSGKFIKIKKQDYLSILKNALTQYERQFKPITFVPLDESIQQISSIQKAIVGGQNIMLSGVSGVGRKTTLILASLILKIDVLTLATSKDYGSREFKKQLKGIIEGLVNQNKKVILFMEDHNFNKPEFIEMINSLIVSGQIPGLFSPDQLQRLPAAQELKMISGIGKSLQEAFCDRVKNNLRIVLSLDYSKDGFKEMCASNPAIFSCNIIWFDNYSSQSLRTIASEYLTKELPDFSKAIIDQISTLASQTQNNMAQKHRISQRLFYTLLSTYVKIFTQKSTSKKNQAYHLQKGLEKLQQAKQLVDVLSKQAFEKQKLLEVKQTQANKALVEIQRAVSQATQRKRQTQSLSKNLQVQEKRIYQKKVSVEQELAEVQPLIDQAKKSVQGISPANLSELASLPKPPDAIRVVLKTVTRMFGQTNSQWNAIKSFIKNRSFIDNVLNFDAGMITPEVRRDIQNELQKNANSFEKNVIYRASLAAGPLADWVKAILKFSRVKQSIKPLETQLNKLLKDIDSSRQRVQECEKQIGVLDEKVKNLKGVFASKTGQAEVLKNQLKKSQHTLNSAKNLLSKLQDQKVRWDQQHKNIEKEVREYPISSFIATAFTTYLCDKDENEREILVQQLKTRTKMENFNYLNFMINESIQLKWKAQGLSSDSLSMQNSVVIFNSSIVPLLMDPNNQAIEWLKSNRSNIEVTSQTHQKFSNSLELAVRFGKQLLVQEMDCIQPILISLLKRDTIQQGSRVMIKIGDKMIQYSKQFKLYLATRNTSMELPANVISLVSLVNYSVTRSGLESKFLSMVINHERPELQKKKTLLLQNQENLKVSLAKLQEELLQQLGSSSGNILENQALLDNLTKTKVQSTEISQSLKESQQLNINLDRQRNIYRGLARKGANIYLIITQLSKINNMYRFSLKYFTKLFLSCLETDIGKGKLQLGQGNKKGKDSDALALCQVQLNKIVFNNVASSLFKVDRLPFGIFLAKGINPNLISQTQWDFFTGIFPAPLEDKVILPKWASFERQEIFNTFSCALPKVVKSINFNDSEFEKWNSQNEQPEKQYPSSCNRLTPFQRLLLIQVFKPQRLQPALINLVSQQLGISSIGGNIQSFLTIKERQISNTVPVLFIVSAGYDPSKQLQEFCQGQVGRENYLQLSMGGGQNQTALHMLRNAAQKGQWLCLKNLHLVTSWLPTLQKQFVGLEKRHQNFRLFLTSEQHKSFPNVLLETCFKVSYESPPGIKKNFLRIYQQLESSPNPLKANFLLLLAYFHALVLERRTYIPQGWSKSYEFSYSDLKVSQEIISSLIKQYEQTNVLNLQKLYGVFDQGIYGGRIDNPTDSRVLKAYMSKYFNLMTIQGNSQFAFGQTIPKNQKELQQFVAKLPQIDKPQMFGLPNSIDKVVQRNNAQTTIQSLKLLSSALSSETKNLKKQQWAKFVSPILKTWNQVYKQVKDSKFPPIKQAQLMSENPVDSFIYLQAAQALQLLEKINKALNSMSNVLQGKGLMNTEIQKLLQDLLQRRLPKQWQQFWSECQQPLEWVRKFGRKLLLLKNWVVKAQNSRLHGQQFDLAQIYHPGVFINACKQAASRNKIALDKLSLVATFQQSKATENAIKLKGLLLQGSTLHKGLLQDSLNSQSKNLGNNPMMSEQYENLPTLYVDFLANPPPMYSNTEQFCLFSSPLRDRIIIKLQLGISGSSEQKIIAGSALMLRDI